MLVGGTQVWSVREMSLWVHVCCSVWGRAFMSELHQPARRERAWLSVLKSLERPTEVQLKAASCLQQSPWLCWCLVYMCVSLAYKLSFAID